MSRPSTFPTKPGVSSRRPWAVRVSSLPFSASSPIESRPTRGLVDAQHVSREEAAHQGELAQVLGPGLGVGADVDDHDRARGARGDDGDAGPEHALDAAHVQGRRGEHGAGVPGRHRALGAARRPPAGRPRRPRSRAWRARRGRRPRCEPMRSGAWTISMPAGAGGPLEGELLAQDGLVAGQQHLDALGGHRQGGRDRRGRGVVPAHAVEGDADRARGRHRGTRGPATIATARSPRPDGRGSSRTRRRRGACAPGSGSAGSVPGARRRSRGWRDACRDAAWRSCVWGRPRVPRSVGLAEG